MADKYVQYRGGAHVAEFEGTTFERNGDPQKLDEKDAQRLVDTTFDFVIVEDYTPPKPKPPAKPAKRVPLRVVDPYTEDLRDDIDAADEDDGDDGEVGPDTPVVPKI